MDVFVSADLASARLPSSTTYAHNAYALAYVPGDRDGNPFVNAETLAYATAKQAGTVSQCKLKSSNNVIIIIIIYVTSSCAQY